MVNPQLLKKVGVKLKLNKMNKVPCFIRLHGACKEHATSDFESISAAKEWLRCWDRPYTIVRWTPRMILEKYGFKHTGANVFKKNDYIAVVFANNKSSNVTKYSPNVGRILWSETYETLWGLMKYLEKNHN